MNNHPARGKADRNAAERESKKKKLLVMILISLIAVMIVLLVIFVVIPAMKGDSAADFFDPSAKEGVLSSKSNDEIQAELNKIVEEGMFNISIADTIVFQNSTQEGQARIENIKANPYHMRVEIIIDDTGQTVYQSGGLIPGSYIENIKLSQKLPAGTYPATALFSAYDQSDLSVVGQAAAKIKIVVEN